MDSLPSLSVLSYCLSFFVFSTLCPTLFLSLSLYRTLSCSLSPSPHFCPSTTCLHANANLRGRVSEACRQRRVREGSGRKEAFVCLDRCTRPSLDFCQWSKEPMMLNRFMGHVLSALALALIHYPKSSSVSFRWRHHKQGELITAAPDLGQVASRPPDVQAGNPPTPTPGSFSYGVCFFSTVSLWCFQQVGQDLLGNK